MKKKWTIGLILLLLMLPKPVYAMHIMEGFLPPKWCIAWGAIAIPFILLGYFSIKKTIKENPKTKILLAMAGGFVFVLSALKIPSVTGSCSHPTGIGFGTILFGPTAMSLIGFIVLLFQALLLAHGGITTLGANTFSMAVIGPLGAYITYKIVKKLNGAQWLAIFLAATVSNLLTYSVTSIQLALAFPSSDGGFFTSLTKFLSIFAVTQIPLAISEGILTVIIFNAISSYSKDELKNLKLFKQGGFNSAK